MPKLNAENWKCTVLCCQWCLPQKYSLRQEIHWNSSKGSPIFRCRHHKKRFCGKTSTNFGIKSEERFLPKCNWNTHAYWKCYSSVTQAKTCRVDLCKPNKLYTVGNVMSLAKICFSRHLNNMPVIGSLMRWS